MNNYEPAAFRPPLESRATRKAPIRSNTSNRSSFAAYVPALGQKIKIFNESKIEESFAYLKVLQPNVADIWDQPKPIHFRDQQGRLRKHHFDFLITYTSGEKVAYVIKPWAKASKPAFGEFVKRLAAYTPRSFADRVSIFTDRSYTKTEVKNAKRLFTAKREARPDVDAKLIDASRGLSDAMSIADFLSSCDLVGTGYNGVLRLIAIGSLTLTSTGLITPQSLIVAGEAK